jgi:hypothetical protein
MYVRLGFAIAAHLPAQILLVDEVLAVGDEAFQRRCLSRITELREDGATILFISHDLWTVERICGRALLVEAGRLRFDGPAAAVVSEYRRSVTAGGSVAAADQPARPLTLVRLEFASPDGPVRTGAALKARLSFVATQPLADVVFTLSYHTHGGQVLHCQQTTAFGGPSLRLDAGPGVIEFSCAELGLQPGGYTVEARAASRAGELVHALDSAGDLVVEPGRMVSGYFYMPHTWRLIGGRRQAGAAGRRHA